MIKQLKQPATQKELNQQTLFILHKCSPLAKQIHLWDILPMRKLHLAVQAFPPQQKKVPMKHFLVFRSLHIQRNICLRHLLLLQMNLNQLKQIIQKWQLLQLLLLTQQKKLLLYIQQII